MENFLSLINVRSIEANLTGETMKFRYTSVFSIRGVSLPSDEGEKELVVDSKAAFRAFLTTQPDPHMFEGDRSLAVMGLIMRGIFRFKPTSDEFKEQIANAVEDIKDKRQKEGGSHPFLVIVAEGEVATLQPEHEKDAEDFIVYLDGADTAKIRAEFEGRITALLNSIVSEAGNVIGIRKLSDAVIFFREDGKPVYSYTFSTGTLQSYVSTPLTDDQAQAIDELYRALATDTILQRVQRLTRSSFEIQGDPFRSFLAAWSALEIFVNKVFKKYETAFFDSMLEEGHLEAQRKYLERMRNVMKGKYRLVDKFAVISFLLMPSTADQDLQTVVEAKKLRDKLFHGETVDEKKLPVERVQDLVIRSVRLHIKQG